jgi:probable DNA repair protein
VQREFAMPHATAQLDWELARSITHRLLRSAPQICFSYARQSGDVETRASRLVVHVGGVPQPLPVEFSTRSAPDELTVLFEDASRVPFPPGEVEGGLSVLTYQSQCPFKAFATARFAAQGWNPAEAGLTAAQRGRLLHAALHMIWGGQPKGIRTLNELKALNDRRAFVSVIVHDVFEELVLPGLRERMPERYLELEQLRLTRLLTEWLDYEAMRAPFEVRETESKRVIQLAGLTLDVRLDRIDQLNDGSLLVIDYKTGQVTPKAWELPRPDDVQLPLYGGFALGDGEELGGLVFAKIRSGDQCFAGLVGDAKATLISGLSSTSALVKNNLSGEMLIDWRDGIEQLAKDFLAGRADVNPRDYPKTCEHCGLETLCRISENRVLLEDEEDSEDDMEAGNA